MLLRPKAAILNDGNEEGSAVRTVHDMWKRTGFMRYAAEYWQLANLIMNRISESERQQSETSPEPVTGQDLNVQVNSGPDVILDKYDETSMQQVNDLIRDFQKVNLQ